MTTRPTPIPSRARSRGFTLTEIMIALAMVALLLVGISRIFAITSQTISTGQALSRAMRAQRAITQTMNADIVGVLPTAANVRPYSGMMPLNDATDPDAGMPFLSICNFRVPTYLNQAAMAADPIAPGDAVTDYVARSAAIRGTDLNKDGTESTLPLGTAGGETTPIFLYGERNFRCDTVCFFTRGDFRSQTGVSAAISGGNTSFQGELKTSEAFVWYGQMRVYNSEPNQVDRSAVFGSPGQWLASTSPNLPNRNNRFAEQFILGRMQMVLAEPIDHDQRTGTFSTSATLGGADRKLAEDNTVVATNDPAKPAVFLQRKWWDPNQHTIESNKPSWKDRARPQISPLTINDPVVIFQRDSAAATQGRNRTFYTNETISSTGTSAMGQAATNYQAMFGRTDIAGVGSRQLRKRSRFMQQYDIDYPPNQESSTGDQYEWWENMYVTFNTRFWANPFVSSSGFTAGEPSVNPKSLAQRQQILANGVSQFTVEFAGDFVTQNADGSIDAHPYNNNGASPDGIVDFVAVPIGGGKFAQRTRWYGMPRDVDGDGKISTLPANSRVSEDVLPVSVYAGVPRLPFERIPLLGRTASTPATVLPVNNDYAQNVVEPGTNPNSSAYICVWGARDFETPITITLPDSTTKTYRGQYPTMLRFLIDVRDESGKLGEPLTQELIYYVPDELPQPGK